MTEQEAARALIGMLQEVKRMTGPALGLLRKHWPRAETLQREFERLYERAKWCQDEVEKL